MKQDIRKKIEKSILDEGFPIAKVNSYSFNRKAIGGWKLIIFYSIKLTKGKKRDTQLPIGTDKNLRNLVEEVLEDIIYENVNSTLLTEEVQEPKKNTW